jgi:hypothetical protein
VGEIRFSGLSGLSLSVSVYPNFQTWLVGLRSVVVVLLSVGGIAALTEQRPPSVGRLGPDFAKPSSRLDSAQECRIGQGEMWEGAP